MNLFLIIFLTDIFIMSISYFIGKYAVDKEHKATWKDAQSMETQKSNTLSKIWTKAHPILDFFQDFYYECGRKWEIPGNIKNNIKWFIQRGKRGYSDCDVWELYCYLTDIIIDGAKSLQKTANGCPSSLGNSMALDLDEESKGTKEWKKILGEIVFTFETLKKVDNNEWVMVPDEKDRKNLESRVAKLNLSNRELLFKDLTHHTYHLMTEDEMNRYRKGWNYFRDYFLYLWD